MRLKKLNIMRTAVSVAVTLFLVSDAYSADSSVVDDFESGKTMNNFEGSWAFFDDRNASPYWSGGEKDTTGKLPTDSIINGWKIPLLQGGNSFWKMATKSYKVNAYGDTIFEYSDLVPSTAGNPDGTAGHALEAEFQMGSRGPHWGPGKDDIDNTWVGFGTELASEGNGVNLSKATTITYWAKASVPLDVSFQLATVQGTFEEFSSFYQRRDHFDTEWKQFTAKIKQDAAGEHDGFRQDYWTLVEPGVLPWATDTQSVLPLDASKVNRLEWLITAGELIAGVGDATDLVDPYQKGDTIFSNTNLTEASAKIWIDDIVIHDYVWTPEDAFLAGIKDAGFIKDSLLGTPVWVSSGGVDNEFDNGAWYVFNDAQGRNVTTPITEYSWADTLYCSYPDTNPTQPEMKLLDGTGMNGAGDTAIVAKYILGPAYKQASLDSLEDSSTVDPFVGIGFDLVDTNSTIQPYYDADSAGIQGVAFLYKTSADMSQDYVSFSVEGTQKFKADGANFHVKLPATNGEWKTAEIPFSALVLPGWDDKDKGVTFDRKHITTFQWTAEGAKGDTGTIYVDELYLLDTTTIIPIKSFVGTKGFNANGISVRTLANKILFTLPENINEAKVDLINIAGRNIASETIKSVGSKTASMSLDKYNLANGVYIFRITPKDMNVSVTRSVTIVK